MLRRLLFAIHATGLSLKLRFTSWLGYHTSDRPVSLGWFAVCILLAAPVAIFIEVPLHETGHAVMMHLCGWTIQGATLPLPATLLHLLAASYPDVSFTAATSPHAGIAPVWPTMGTCGSYTQYLLVVLAGPLVDLSIACIAFCALHWRWAVHPTSRFCALLALMASTALFATNILPLEKYNDGYRAGHAIAGIWRTL